MLVYRLAAVCFLTLSLTPSLQQSSRTQDIEGAASRIFGAPRDPEVKHENSSRAAKNSKATNTSDAVETALGLGNSARNSKPPRYHDAEVAYRLAAQLDPKDPRSAIGLANIWYDQKQYEAAAKMYREAYSLTSSAMGGSLRGRLPPRIERSLAQVNAAVGVSLLQSGKFAEAEAEFEKAVSSDANNPRWYALKGYSLLKLGKQELAEKAFRLALQMDPDNDEYRTLVSSTAK